MKESNYLRVFVSICLLSVVLSQNVNVSCNYEDYDRGCEDEMGSECDVAGLCKCKPNYWHIEDSIFCFPTQCPRGLYYDHNLNLCLPQKKAALNYEDNYCKHNFHCLGDHIQCKKVKQWNKVCVCDDGFKYDSLTEECIVRKGIYGHCLNDTDCNPTSNSGLVCNTNQLCQCKDGTVYSVTVDGCEDRKDVAARHSHTRKIMFLFIGLGLFFGLALSMKCGSNSVGATQQMLMKQIVERRQKEREERRLQKLQEQEPDIAIDLEATHETNKTENLINNRETA